MILLRVVAAAGATAARQEQQQRQGRSRGEKKSRVPKWAREWWAWRTRIGMRRTQVDRGATTARRSTGLLWWSRRGATKAFDACKLGASNDIRTMFAKKGVS